MIHDGVFNGSTRDESSDGSAGCARSSSSPDVWYRFDAEEPGVVTASLCGSSYDTALSVHNGCPGDEDSEITCNDDSCALQSRVSFSVNAGEQFLLRVSGFSGASGDFELTVETSPAEPNGDCEDAPAILIGETISGATTDASNDGSANCGSSRSSPDRIFRYDSLEECLLTARTCGSDFDTVVSIHTGCPPTRDNEIDCNDDACGLQSSVAANVDADRTYWIRVAGFSGSTGNYLLELECTKPPEQSDGADLTIAYTDSIRQVGREGSWVALSMGSMICNIGDVSIDWRGNPDPRHPFLVFNLYRLMDGRMTQVGQSWAKHGFAASQTSGVCGLSCDRDSSGDLGPGCADYYGSGTNAAQSTFGSRPEVNPFSGEFVYEGSHLEERRGGHDDVDHRLAVHDDDLDPAQNPDARYFVELYVVSHDDVDHTNSLGHQEVTVDGSPGGSWDLGFAAAVSDVGPIFDAWDGASWISVPEAADLTDDGRCYVSAKVTENDDGTFRYEYGVFNLDMDRAVESFSVDVPAGVSVQDIGFHAPVSDNEEYSNAPWQAARSDDELTWSTVSHSEDPASNPLRWGLLYSFWFNANAAPEAGEIRISAYQPGGEEHAGLSTVPGGDDSPLPGFKRMDVDGNGEVEMTDAIALLTFQFRGGETLVCLDAADSDDSNELDISDPIGILLWLFRGGFTVPAPGPIECGPDPTPSGFAACEYPGASC